MTLGTVCRRKTEIDVKAAAHVVTVEDERLVSLSEKLLFRRHSEGRFPGSREPGEPNDPALVAVTGGARRRPHPMFDRWEVA